MAKNIYAGTKTEQNLWAAFAGESQARNKYTYFASVAKKAGYEQIAELFLKTAENEKEHAKLWFKALGELGDTAENLLHAAEGENYEWTDMTVRLYLTVTWFVRGATRYGISISTGLIASCSMLLGFNSTPMS